MRGNGSGETEGPGGTISISEPPIERLSEILGAFPHGEDVADLVRQAYQPGVTFGAGFQALLDRLLAKFGFLFINPLDEAVRRLAAPLLRNALRNGQELNARLLQRNQQLEAGGYPAPGHSEAKTSLAFLLGWNHRRAPWRQNRQFAITGRPQSVD